ncbi:thump domain-containing protein [Apiospora rasikravindrae]|uniref:Thump domain-containing protein n=1 Tax=Apiospora rasikravindrae TaxID=990691 RepID=A0ABR1TGQ5_9PEZI
MSSAPKRKDAPGGGGDQGRLKKSKGGNFGKWQTPHQKAKMETMRSKGRTLDIGDVGFWVTCQRNKEIKALDEVVAMCDEYGEKLYGIKPMMEDGNDSEDEGDIEAAIQKEVAGIKKQASNSKSLDTSAFAPMRLSLDCLLFVKTKQPVEPRQFARKVCEDAMLVSDRKQRRSRFINRITPITLMGSATKVGIEETARTVLASEFDLIPAGEEAGSLEEKDAKGPSYAIRVSSRAQSNLKTQDVIKLIASLVGPRHKVDLTNPDKFILVEIFQTFCGMSVVEGDWNDLKRYNIRELYEAASAKADGPKTEERPKDGLSPESNTITEPNSAVETKPDAPDSKLIEEDNSHAVQESSAK